MRPDEALARGGWPHRRSLASPVAGLTTLALGGSIATLRLTAYGGMRQHLVTSLDQSLLNRAHRAAADTTLSGVAAGQIPSWLLGAADIGIILINAEGRGITGTAPPSFTL